MKCLCFQVCALASQAESIEILVKAQSIISAPLIANYILKLKVKKNVWQNVGGVEMPFEMKSFFKS